MLGGGTLTNFEQQGRDIRKRQNPVYSYSCYGGFWHDVTFSRFRFLYHGQSTAGFDFAIPWVPS
jgi:hypothetical protein